MKKITMATALLAFSLNAAAQNADGFYSEAAYSSITIRDLSSNSVGAVKPSVARFTFGGVMVDNLALEGFVAQSLKSDSVNAFGLNNTVSVKAYYGIALRPFINLSDKFELYGRLGSAHVNYESYYGKFGNTHSLYGIGLGYKLKNNLKIVADYTQLSTYDESRSSLVSIGVRLGY
jgi:hypothetical protein